MDINLLQESEAERLRQLTADAQRIVVCCHKSPDGDAVGSSLAWADYLTSLDTERKVTVVLPDAAPDFLHWLPGFQSVVRHDKKPEEVKLLLDEADLVCCLDFNTFSRTDAMQPLLDACEAPKLVIDHHLNPDIKAVMTISRPKMSSTSEMIFRLIWQLGGYEEMTLDSARCLYCGMMTDTGAFTYNSSDPEIYLIISYLLAKGVNKDNIYKRVYHHNSLNSMRLRSYVIYRKMRVVEELHAAYFCITKEEMRRFRFQKGDAEGLVNEPLKIKGMRLSISLREDTECPNLVLVSLRSSCGFHCEKVARRYFNGGGHEDAAGGKLFCSIEEAEQVAVNAILAFKDQLK